jgi:hypothetical protein
MADYGEKGRKAIEKLDSYLESKGDKYKSHYATMFSWVLRAVDEDDAKQARASPPGSNRPVKGWQELATDNAFDEWQSGLKINGG